MNAREMKRKLEDMDLTFTDLDRRFKLPHGTCRVAAAVANPKGEHAISKALNMPAKDIFPERYDELGNRLRPQPRSNYTYKRQKTAQA